MDRFRMPTGGSDEDLRTKLRAFADAIEDIGLAGEFEELGHEGPVAELRQTAEDFRGSEGEQGDALANQVGATKSIPALIREGRAAVKTFNAMFSLFYKGNVGMLAAWKSASHLERDGSGDAEEPAAQPAPCRCRRSREMDTKENGDSARARSPFFCSRRALRDASRVHQRSMRFAERSGYSSLW
jgi:hypothetical protein